MSDQIPKQSGAVSEIIGSLGAYNVTIRLISGWWCVALTLTLGQLSLAIPLRRFSEEHAARAYAAHASKVVIAVISEDDVAQDMPGEDINK